MIEYLSKRKFINALASEAASHAQRAAAMERPPRGLSLEFVPPEKGSAVLTLVTRGNQVPQEWMMLEGQIHGREEGATRRRIAALLKLPSPPARPRRKRLV